MSTSLTFELEEQPICPIDEENTFTNLKESFLNGIHFVWNRFPNMQETLYSSFPSSLIQTLLGSFAHSFGSNPTAKIVIRDMTKLPSILLTYWQETEIGSTGTHYDIGSVIGSLGKTTCKVGIIGGAFFSGYPVGAAALIANPVCEIPARTFKVTSREYQKATKNDETSLSYGEFMWENLVDLSIRGIKEAITKTFTSDILVGNTLSEPVFSPIKNYAESVSVYLTTAICTALTGTNVNLQGQMGMYAKAGACFAAANVVNSFTTAAIYATVGAVETVITTLRESVTSEIFVPIVSSVADSSIPDLLFGSPSEVISTLVGVAAGGTCSYMIGHPVTCTAVGAAVKGGIDYTISLVSPSTESNTAAVVIIDESHKTTEQNDISNSSPDFPNQPDLTLVYHNTTKSACDLTSQCCNCSQESLEIYTLHSKQTADEQLLIDEQPVNITPNNPFESEYTTSQCYCTPKNLVGDYHSADVNSYDSSIEI